VEKLNECAAFIKRNGRPPSSSATDPEEKSLYYWRAGQQHLKSIGKLKPHRLELLIKAGILKTGFEYEWHSFFEQMKEFMEKNKRLPIRLSDDPQEKRLGQWRQQQFALYKSGKMQEDRAKLLESLGVATTVTNAKWNTRFRQLQLFLAKHGTLPSRSATDENEKELSRWLETQQFLMNKGEMAKRRKTLLESLDLPKSRLDERWDSNLEAVRIFIYKHDRLPSTLSNRAKERSLAVWCNRQRAEKRVGRLSTEKVDVLESLGIFQNQKLERWKERLKEVYQFNRKYGALPSRTSFSRDESLLGRWCEHQRELHAKGKLPKERIPLLKTAGVIR
jgi:hypothetical protein